MKRIIAIILAVVSVLLLVACAGKAKGSYDLYANDINMTAMGSSRYVFKGNTVTKYDKNGQVSVKGKVTYNGKNVHIEFDDGYISDYIYDSKKDIFTSPAPYEAFTLRKSK